MRALFLVILTPVVLRLSIANVVAGEAAAAALKPLDYFIVVTGGELLEGAYPDAHTPFITRTLRILGAQCVGSITVDDRREEIQSAIRFATNKAPLIIVTGGLGPTPNDITRETLSEFTAIPLREEPSVLSDMEKRFNQNRDQLRPTLRKQTLVPMRGGYLRNVNGTAVGLIFEAVPSVLVALPGPPRELQPMVRDELAPYLQRRFGLRKFGASVTLRFVGAGQSLIAQTIKDHVAVAPDVIVTSVFNGSRVDFTFSTPGRTDEERTRLKQLVESIRGHLSEFLYAEDSSSLEEVVLKKLQDRGETMAIAEVATGGTLAASLNAADAKGKLLAGAFSASTERAMHRLLGIPFQPEAASPEERVKALAAAAANRTGSSSAIAVGGLESNGASERFVWIAFKSPVGPTETKRLAIRASKEIVRPEWIDPILDEMRKRWK